MPAARKSQVSPKVAAEADPNLGESARQAVLDAHLAICILKTEI